MIKLSIKAVSLLALALACVAQTTGAQPLAKGSNVVAVVLGKQVVASDTNELTGLILGPLLEQFASENHIEPTADDLDALVRRMDEAGRQTQASRLEERAKLTQELKSPSLPAGEREKKEARQKKVEKTLKYLADAEQKPKQNDAQALSEKREVAMSFAKPWKVNQALYRKYGGRVAFQQAGPEPLDAYRDFLREQEKKGNFKILDSSYATGFWGCFTNDAGCTFYSEAEGAKMLNTPFWLLDQAPKK